MSDLSDVVKKLSDSKKILITGSPKMKYDELSSLAALSLLLADQDKKITVSFPKKLLGFRDDLLRRYKVRYSKSLDPMSYIISLPYDKGEIEKVSYDTKQGKVNLYITPGKSEFDFDNVRYAVAGSNFDAILVVGCRSLKWLGATYTQNSKAFDRSTVINMNNRKGNQDFGDLMLVDSSKATVSEMVYEMISLLGGSQNQNIINVLTEGMVAGLNLIQRGKLRENSFDTLNNLVKAGGNVKTAINKVFFSNPLQDFELYKKAFKDIKSDTVTGVVWSVMNLATMKGLGIDGEKIYTQARLPFNNSRKFKVAFALYEIENGKVLGVVESNGPKISAIKLVREFKGRGGSTRAEFLFSGKSVAEMEQAILAQIQKALNAKSISSGSRPVERNKKQVKATDKGQKVPNQGFVSPPQMKEASTVPLGTPTKGDRKPKQGENRNQSKKPDNQGNSGGKAMKIDLGPDAPKAGQ